MVNENETINFSMDFNPSVASSLPKTTLAMLNRTHSLELPDDFEVESTGVDIENEEGFQAALQLLEESDYLENLSKNLHKSETRSTTAENVDISSTSGTDAEDSSVRDPPQATKPKTKKRHRVSMKQQIDTLRGTVQELTTQLQSLETEVVQTSSTDSHNEQQSGNVSRNPLWQQIAARQLERRQEAERDNAELRMMLEQQILEAKNLKRILKRRSRIDMMEEMLGVKRHKMLANNKPDDGLNELQALLRCTDEIYVGVDQMFTEKGMEFVPCPGQTRHVNRHAVNDVFLEFLVKQLVPFGEKVTENAVWTALGQFAMQPLQCVKDVNGQVDFYAQNSQETADTMMINYSIASSGFRQIGLKNFRIRKVVRKYVEENRNVFICRMESQAQHTSGRTGIKQRCNIRVIVEKSESVDDDSEITTVIKSYYSISRHVPVDEDYRSYADVDMAITVWDETIGRVTGDIESILLEDRVILRGTTSRSRN